MDLKAKIGQMIVVRASGYLRDRQRRYPQWEADNQTLQKWLRESNIGGVILLGGSAVEIKERSQQLQSWAQTPLLIAADIEEGVGQRFTGLTWFPPPMALNAVAQKDLELAKKYAFQMGEITARETLAIGINWLLAPVVDVNNNPDNPVINIRAFSDRSEITSKLTVAFIEGARQHSILTTAKHFPGHGDTATDSHLTLPTISHDESRLQTVELPPFQSALDARVDSVMTAHLTIPTWDKEYPATLSHEILTEKLRRKMGFDGLIVTDALIMGGITRYADPEEIAVMAVKAGVDVLLMPDDPQVAIESIYQAVTLGKIDETRIDRSVARIMAAKEKVEGWKTGGKGGRGARLAPISIREDRKDNRDSGELVVEEILKDSIKSGGNLPLEVTKSNSCRNLIVVDDVLNSSFLDLQTPAIAVPQQLGYQRQILDRNSLELIAKDERKTLLQLFIRGNPFRGSAGLSPEAIQQYQKLSKSDRLIGLIIYGSPYVFDLFLPNLDSDIPWIFTYGQMDLAQAIALARLFNLAVDRDTNVVFPTNIENFGF